MGHFHRTAALAVALTAILGLSVVIYGQQSRVVNTASNVATNVTNDVLRRTGAATDPLPGSWLSYGRDQDETRYSTLKQIDSSNAKRLGLAWSYVMGAGGGNQEGTPLMWNNTLYGITTWSVVFALDARTGKELWRWDPEVNPTTRSAICCGNVNRGIALYNGMIIAPSIDGRLFALNALTGKPVWESRVVYSQDQYTLTMAPRIANGKVVIGASGGDKPTRGQFAALDAQTGQLLWRFYTVPGDPSKPYESEALRRAAKTWGGDFWKNGGGGAVWDGFAYDPEANLVYVGTGNAEPWVQKFRGAQGLTGSTGYVRPQGQTKIIEPTMGPEPPAGARGGLQAWDPVKQTLKWNIEGGGGIGGGTTTTAGNLVFQVVNDGRFRAVTADKGEVLYEVKVNRTGMAAPITYEVDGKQYVAFGGGLGRAANVAGPNNAKVDNAPMMFVFTLDGTAELPPPPPPAAAPAVGPGAVPPVPAGPAPEQRE